MDAPTYLPAQAYEAPIVQPRVLTTRGTSISDLMTRPAIWEEVTNELPALPHVVKSPLARPHLGNVPLTFLLDLGLADQSALDRVELVLAALGEVE